MSDAPPDSSSGPLKLRREPRDFPVANQPASTPTTEPTDVAAHFRAATAPRPDLTPAAPPPAENDVHAILRDNVAAATAAGLNDLAPKPRRRSRRLRDYLIVTAAINLPLAGIALAFRRDPVVLIFVLAGFILFNVRFSWSVWAVMDDY